MGKDRDDGSEGWNPTKMSKVQMVIVALAVVGAIAAVIYLALFSPAAKAGQQEFVIPVPNGTKFEINGAQGQIEARKQGDRMKIVIAHLDPERRTKARWYYAGANCYSDGRLDNVLYDIERCANNAVRTK